MKAPLLIWIVGSAAVLIVGWILEAGDGERYASIVTVPLVIVFMLSLVSRSRRRRPPT
jgi:hypothetical protein